ncbi:Cytochrome P450 2D28 [Holothuria leucospilota]|uniref:Cytochrome P450 2D28 n=1 Tax=Holothuria leucospilota TaxID=206669 RepID=A0A9Q1BDF8_HOLLE|nr:Cytochrome P450 2D28 [Holothuria leucospilota]
MTKKFNFPPGPYGLPVIANLPAILSSNPTEYFTKCSHKFGDIYNLRFGQRRVCILSSTDLVREVFNSKNAQDRVTNVAYYKVFGKNAHGVAFSSKDPWKDSRRFILGLFRDLGVGRGVFESKVTSEAELVKKLAEGINRKEVDLKQKFFWAVGNITCGIVFGKQYDYNDPTLKQFINFVDVFPKVSGPGALVLTSPFLCALPFGPGYKAAVIHETLRISNVAPLGIPHVTDKDIKLSGFDIPKGTTIAANMTAILMNDKIFKNPDKVNPDRFIKNGVFEESSHVIPFSTGTRVCIGEKLARMELLIFLAHLLFRYSFKPPKDVTMPRILDGVEYAVARCPMPYSVVKSERYA